MSTLKELRNEKNMTQAQAAELLQVSLRSYKDYENEEKKSGTIKYNYFLDKLLAYNPIDEEHGILTVNEITRLCQNILSKYDVSFCYLFGSYAKGTAKETSDIDLLIDSSVSGLKFYGMVEELRESLKKKVDVLDLKQLDQNIDLLREVLKDGIKIYG